MENLDDLTKIKLLVGELVLQQMAATYRIKELEDKLKETDPPQQPSKE